MATFYNQATLSYNGNTTTSNITTGELLEVLSATKTALRDTYAPNENVTYVISILNSGNTAFTGLTVTDNLGAIAVTGTDTRYPLTFVDGSLRYYVNGTLHTAPTAVAGPPLTISGVNVPAGGNAILIYQARVNRFAPLDASGSITNTATISGVGVNNDITVSETITPANEAMLTISKSLSPTTVTENGQITYTFIIQNLGNTAADVADNVAITDTFNPILNPISVTFNGTAWDAGTNYTYNNLTGAFATVPGQITVPAATYTQDAATGAWTVNPGVSTLTVTGTV
ncbi:MAG: hypothetical protein NC079_07160 [Clostridium sp.]|nr:hypothetical protein [Acetatifactor muris]MCM1527683.1 hypothetical protein [Bacteroides sp.]MCM1563373.1 hypothetical protein [Clostridium sp.]